MISRITFGPELVRALHVRGMTVPELAGRARVSIATAASALHGHPVNASSALRLCQALSSVEPIKELQDWVAA